MLLQSLDRLKEVCELPHIKDALDCLEVNQHQAAPARFEFPGGFLMLQAGDTKPMSEGDFEAHIKYLDIQGVL